MRPILDLWRYARLAAKHPTTPALLPEYGEIIPAKRDNDFGFASVEPTRIVFAFTGSDDLKDWIENADAFPVTEDYVHAGFWSAWLDFQGFVYDVVKTYGAGRSIFVTGYSRGAALALLCARGISHGTSIPCSLITFGGPRVGGKAFREDVDSLPINHTRVVHGYDIVTTLPPELLGYRHCGKLFHLPENFLHFIFCKIADHVEANYDRALKKRFPNG